MVAVGAPGADDPQSGENTGAVNIYLYDGQNWVETVTLTPSQTPQAKIGRELVLSGNILAVSGSPAAEDVYIYQREAGGWREVDFLQFFCNTTTTLLVIGGSFDRSAPDNMGLSPAKMPLHNADPQR